MAENNVNRQVDSVGFTLGPVSDGGMDPRNRPEADERPAIRACTLTSLETIASIPTTGPACATALTPQDARTILLALQSLAATSSQPGEPGTDAVREALKRLADSWMQNDQAETQWSIAREACACELRGALRSTESAPSVPGEPGTDAVRAHVHSALECYALEDGDNWPLYVSRDDARAILASLRATGEARTEPTDAVGEALDRLEYVRDHLLAGVSNDDTLTALGQARAILRTLASSANPQSVSRHESPTEGAEPGHQNTSPDSHREASDG